MVGMPIENTRKWRAMKLYKLIKKGPDLIGDPDPMSHSQFCSDYELWVRTWVLPELRRLIKELKEVPE
jgi:hypothetical protein